MELYQALHNCWNLFCAAFVVAFFVVGGSVAVICLSREVFAWVSRRVR